MDGAANTMKHKMSHQMGLGKLVRPKGRKESQNREGWSITNSEDIETIKKGYLQRWASYTNRSVSFLSYTKQKLPLAGIFGPLTLQDF
jgi:hypothetical protein